MHAYGERIAQGPPVDWHLLLKSEFVATTRLVDAKATGTRPSSLQKSDADKLSHRPLWYEPLAAKSQVPGFTNLYFFRKVSACCLRCSIFPDREGLANPSNESTVVCVQLSTPPSNANTAPCRLAGPPCAAKLPYTGSGCGSQTCSLRRILAARWGKRFRISCRTAPFSHNLLFPCLQDSSATQDSTHPSGRSAARIAILICCPQLAPPELSGYEDSCCPSMLPTTKTAACTSLSLRPSLR